MKNIVIATDIPVSKPEIINAGINLSQQYKSKLWLIHVTPPDPQFVGYKVGPQSVRDNIAKIFHEEHKALQCEAEVAREQNIETTALLLQGPVGETILEESSHINADIIVIGDTSHGTIHKTILGSVADYVLRHSKLPILVVPCR